MSRDPSGNDPKQPRRRPGRPSLPPDEVRQHRISVRLSDVEYAQLMAAAVDRSISVATYMRQEAMKHRIRPRPMPKADPGGVPKLNELGRELNLQLHMLHTGRAPLGIQTTLNRLQEHLERIKADLLSKKAELE